MPAHQSNDIRAGGAYVEVYDDQTKLDSGLQSARQKLQGFASFVRSAGTALSVGGTAIIAPLTVAAKAFERAADVGDVAKKLNVPVESISGLEYAASQLGTSLKDLGKDSDKWAAFIQDAGGSAGLKKLIDRHRELGLVMKTEDVSAAREYRAAMSELWAVTKQGTYALGAAVAPAIADVTRKMTGSIAATINWVREHSQWVQMAFQVAAKAVAIGAAMVVAGRGIAYVASIVGAGASAMTAIVAVLGFMLSPIGLVTAGFIGLTIYLGKFTNVASSAKSFLSGIFGDMADDAKTAFGGIRDALATGDLAAAANILWLALKVEFQRGMNAINELWADWSALLGAPLINAVAIVRVAWVEAVGFMTDAWLSFVALVESTFAKVASRAIAIGIRIAEYFADDKSQKLVLGLAAGLTEASGDSTAKKATGDRDAAIGAAELDRKQRLAEIEAGRQAALGGGDNGIAAGQAELEARRRELQAAVRAAAVAKAGKKAAEPGGLQLPDLDNVKSSVLGTFNALGAGRALGGAGDVQTKILEENKKQNGKLDKLIQKPAAAGLGFA